MAEQGEDLLEAVDRQGAGGFGGGGDAVRVGEFGVELRLSDLELLDCDRVVHVGVDQFRLVPLEVGDALLLALEQAKPCGGRGRELGMGLVCELVDLFVAELECRPLAQDVAFELVDGDVREAALGPAAVLAEAEEVLVLAAASAGDGVAEAALAAAASH